MTDIVVRAEEALMSRNIALLASRVRSSLTH